MEILPSINNLINENEEIEYYIIENDADANYDFETNIKSIKSGDYGFCLDYNSKYSISDLDFENNEKIKEEIQSIILKGVKYFLEINYFTL